LLKYKYYHIQNNKLYDTFSEAHRLKAYLVGVVGKILGPKREEIIGDRRKLHKEKLGDLRHSPNVIQLKNHITGCNAYLGKDRNAQTLVVGRICRIETAWKV
jgi:hypothetical protein